MRTGLAKPRFAVLGVSIFSSFLLGCSASQGPESYASRIERISTNVPYQGKRGQSINIHLSIQDAQSNSKKACVLSGEGPIFILKDSDAPSGYKQVVSGLEDSPCIGYVSEALIEPIPGGSSLVSQKRRSYSVSCNPNSAKYVLTVNEFADQFNLNRARVESRYKNVCIGLVGAPIEIDKVVGQYELTLSPFNRKKGELSYTSFSKDPKVVANFPRGSSSIESVNVRGGLVKVYGKFKGFNDAFGGLFVNFDVSMLDQDFPGQLREVAEKELFEKRSEIRATYLKQYSSKSKEAVNKLQRFVDSGNPDFMIARQAWVAEIMSLAVEVWEKYDPKDEYDLSSVGSARLSVWVPRNAAGLEDAIAKLEESASNYNLVKVNNLYELSESDVAVIARFKGGVDQPSSAQVDSQEASSGDDIARRSNSCVASDPSDTYINLRETPNGRLVGPVNNGRSLVVVGDSVSDSKGRPWIKVSVPSKSMVGYAMKSLTSGC